MHREPTRTTEEFGGAFISRLGPLFKIISNRNLFSARFSRGMVVADMVCNEAERKMEESERAKSDEIAAKQRQREQELEERITAPIAAPAPAASGKKYIPPCLRPNYKAPPPVVESDGWDTRKKNDPDKW
ncbi:hypothetical protein Tco_0973601 [Tanacetum coccineum]